MSTRSFINRTSRDSKRFATGKYAVGICHRSGFKVPWRELVFEPGTNYLVHKSEDDGPNSLVTHPQNFPPEKKTERIALRWSSFDTQLSIGTVVSAEQLFLPSYASVSGQFIQYAYLPDLTSIGTGVSVSTGTATSAGAAMDFSISTNSQYYIVVFSGI